MKFPKDFLWGGAISSCQSEGAYLEDGKGLSTTDFMTSGTKTSTRYTASGHAVFAVKVDGSFKYTGSSSWSTSASATVSIYDSNASYVSKSASYSSNYASATGNVTYLGTPISRTVTLYCDKDGNLS